MLLRRFAIRVRAALLLLPLAGSGEDQTRITAVLSGTPAAAGMRMHVLPSGSRFDPRTGEATLP